MDTQEFQCGRFIVSEYEAQYFGFTPRAFADTWFNTMNDGYEEWLPKFSSTVKKLMPGEIAETVIHCAYEKGKKHCIKFNSIIDQIEKYFVWNIFRIPEQLVLPEDKEQMQFMSFSKVENEKLDEEIGNLEKRHQALMSMQEKLRDELCEINFCKRRMADTLNLLRPQASVIQSILKKK